MITIYHREQFDRLPAPAAHEADFDPASVAAEGASAHLVLEREGTPAARCSAWWEHTPPSPDKDREGVCGAIGHFAAEDPADAETLLRAACGLLREQGCIRALAPMHGNTYRSYRYATGGLDRPPFLMEPPAAAGRDRLLEASGFAPVERYHSYLEPLDGADDAAQRARLEHLAAHGVELRPLEPDRLDETLGAIYRLSCTCFRDNPYYTDIDEASFRAQYLAYRRLLVPEFILLAHKGGDCVGFAFCIPDYLEGARPHTVLLKTAGVLPGCRRLGIGAALLGAVRQAARAQGFTHAVGALVHEDNVSKQLLTSQRVLRRYTLYGKEL